MEEELALVNTDADGRLLSEDRGDRLNVGEIRGVLLRQLGGVRVAAGLGIASRPRQRVEQYVLLEVLGVRRRFLDLDERVVDHHLTHGLVRKTSANAILDFVRLVRCRADGTEDVARVDNHDGTADLTETER